MSDAPLMLGVSGLRGIVGKSLTPEVAARFAAAFGAWLRETFDESPVFVVIARDGRAGGEAIHEAAIRGLLRGGCCVHDLGIAATPSVGVACDLNAYRGGMVVTASHNPQEWNGLKCLVRQEAEPWPVDACAPSGAAAAAIIERFNQQVDSQCGGPTSVVRDTAWGSHAIDVAKLIREMAFQPSWGETRRRFRVVLDSVNGAGRFGGRELLLELACELIHHGAESSGLFPHPPEPTRENLQSLCAAVTKFGADIGFAQDPDADRLAIVDENGEYIGEEYTLALAAESLLSMAGTARPPVLVANLSTSRMIDDIAARHGGRVVRTPVGEANVVEAMKREAAAGHNVVLGGEGNGGVIWPRVTYVRDSLSAMALILALMARTGKTVSQLVADIPAYAIEKRKVDLARKEDAKPAIDKLAAFYSPSHRLTVSPSQPPLRIDLQDGIRIDWDGPLPGGGSGKAWLHVRASNTEPIMRLIAEAPSSSSARLLLDDAARQIGI